MPPASRTTVSPAFDALVDGASQRYRASGVAAWQFARGKLRGDPLYRAVWQGPWIDGGTLLDIGCGQGLMLAVFDEARRQLTRASADRRTAAALARLPHRLIGVETRPRVAEQASRALSDAAEILTADARTTAYPLCRTIFVFDVLHLMPRRDQERLLDQLTGALEPGGWLLIREVDAGSGWRFRTVQLGNSMKALLGGRSPSQFHFRATSAWKRALIDRGLDVDAVPMNTGTPFGNILVVARRSPPAA